MKKVTLIATALALIFTSGCASKTVYVDTDSSRLIANVDEINIQDFASAADQMMQSLIDNCLSEQTLTARSADKPVIAISRIINNTSNQGIDTDLLIKRIRTKLTNTKSIYTSTTLNLKKGDDPLAQDAMQYEEALNEETAPMQHDYSLSGKIIEVTTRTGNLRQSTYEFQLTLSDRRGLVVWEDVKDITKQGKKASVGF